MSSPQHCPECGRRPSERVESGSPLQPAAPCPHWTHDAADAALEMLTMLREAVGGLDEYWMVHEGEDLSDRTAILLSRFPEEGQ